MALTGTLVIRSRVSPPVTVTLGGPAGTGTSALSAAAVKALQPAVDVTVAGQNLGTWAPAGDPGQGTPAWVLGVVILAAIVFGSIGLYTVTKGLR